MEADKTEMVSAPMELTFEWRTQTINLTEPRPEYQEKYQKKPTSK